MTAASPRWTDRPVRARLPDAVTLISVEPPKAGEVSREWGIRG